MDGSTHDRLRRARIAAGYRTVAAVVRAFGWNKNTYKSHENGVRGLRAEQAQQYARAFGVSAAWLLTGESPPKWARAGMPVTQHIPSRQVPMLDSLGELETLLGTVPFVVSAMARLITIPADPRLGERVVAVRVDDDSMTAKPAGSSDVSFQRGDTLIVSLDVSAGPGDIVVARRASDPEPVIRRYRYRGRDRNGGPIIDLAPLNEDFDTVRLDADNPGTILGRVMQLVRNL